ncbi:MAG: trigger factor [Candidatus Saccharimonadaceae bacterium]|nr:trigger factor [Candidatus Saccharimonadaceae bacterium]
MKTTTKNISDTKVELTIILDAEELAIAEQVATVKLARDVKVPGFRKGKTPVAIAAKNIDPSVLQEQTVENALNKAIATAFGEQKIQVLDRPMVSVTKFVPGEILEFKAEAEVLPKIKLGDYKKLKITPEKISVSKQEIDEIIERIRKGLADKKEVKRAAKLNDEVIIDFVGKKDGKEFEGGKSNDFNLVLGSGQFIPGFEEGIVGHKTGETFDINLTFPEDYGNIELKGVKTTFTVTIKKTVEVVLPEIDDKFAAKAGPFKTVEELTSDIKKELKSQKERESKEKIKEELIAQLVEVSNVPVPEILIIDQIKSIEQDFTQNLMYQGLSLDQYLKNKGYDSKQMWLDTEARPIAEKRVKSGLALAELSKVEKIEATTIELDAQVDKFKQQYANNADALKQFDNPEVRRDIANRLLTEKTVERLVELNKK